MLDYTFTDTLTARLNAAARAAIDFTPAMAAIADYMRSEAVTGFETETGPDGARWRPSARALEDGGLTLTDTGQLRQSITAASDATSAIAGTNLIYAAIHQFGGTIRPKAGKKALATPFGARASVTMPARPFLGFGADDVIAIDRILVRHLDAAFGSGSGGAA
jgi:phage virion morphogenesis protein